MPFLSIVDFDSKWLRCYNTLNWVWDRKSHWKEWIWGRMKHGQIWKLFHHTQLLRNGLYVLFSTLSCIWVSDALLWFHFTQIRTEFWLKLQMLLPLLAIHCLCPSIFNTDSLFPVGPHARNIFEYTLKHIEASLMNKMNEKPKPVLVNKFPTQIAKPHWRLAVFVV